MKRILYSICGFLLVVSAQAQIALTTLPSGGNKRASVSERVGLTDINIRYDRPAVKDRQGKIWGQLVPVGFTDPGFGSSKSAPWRAGANENTVMTFSSDVIIEGKKLPAGSYGFFIAYDPAGSTLIFSKNSSSWGHYYYNEAEDALRVQVKSKPIDHHVEWLKYEFTDQQENSAIIQLQWEKLAVPFKVEVDYVKDQIESFRKELRTQRGFTWQSWDQAAQWAVQRNTNLEEALRWTDSSTNNGFGGNRIFQAWSTRSQILQKLGRQDEAKKVMQHALAFGSVNEVHQYGRQLLGLKMNQEAFETFKMNHDKHPNQFTTLVGLARGYSAIGDYKNALVYANKALPLAPDQLNKTSIAGMIAKLKENKDVN